MGTGSRYDLEDGSLYLRSGVPQQDWREAGEKVIAMIHAGYPEIIPASRPRKEAAQLLTVVDSYPESGIVE